MVNIALWRTIHRYTGLGLAAFLIFYSITGLLLNHRKLFDYFIETRVTVSTTTPMDVAPLHQALEIGRTHIDRSDDPTVIRIPDGETIEFLYGSHGKTTYRFKPAKGVIEKTEKHSMKPWSHLNNLHKIVGTGNFWLVCADAFCLLLIVLTVSGLVILRYRRQDFLVLGAGVALLLLGMFLA